VCLSKNHLFNLGIIRAFCQRERLASLTNHSVKTITAFCRRKNNNGAEISAEARAKGIRQN
jgi:hypothetical protein